jgi:hypothetical protein
MAPVHSAPLQDIGDDMVQKTIPERADRSRPSCPKLPIRGSAYQTLENADPAPVEQAQTAHMEPRRQDIHQLLLGQEQSHIGPPRPRPPALRTVRYLQLRDGETVPCGVKDRILREIS